jgi:phenylacetate-CoA ligase
LISYQSPPLQSVYFALPLLLKSLVATIYGLRQRQERYGKAFEKHLAFLKSAEYWPTEQLREFQKERLDTFLREVVRTTPYYVERAIYRTTANGGPVEDLPILTKAEVRANNVALTSTATRHVPHRWMKTSGTTGTSLRFPVSRDAFQREYAYRVLHNSWGGVAMHKRDRIAFCAGHPVAFFDRQRPPFWVHDHANNTLFLSSYHLTAKNLHAYVEALEGFGPLMLAGYPSSLLLLALAYRKYGSGGLRLRSVFTSSETLYEFQRKTIADAFGVSVFNYYGNTEMVANAMECERGVLHLNLHYGYEEVLGANGRVCQPGETGRLVCTGFGNPLFPLIRYEIGDVVTIASQQDCLCGRGGLMLERIEGRMEEYIVTPDGRLVGRLDHLFKNAPHVEEAQIIQTDVREVILRIVRAADYSTQDEGQILRESRLRLGGEIHIRFEYVDRIPRGAGGKFPFILSSIDQSRILQELLR